MRCLHSLQHLGRQAAVRPAQPPTCSLGHPLQVVLWHPPGAEDPPVSKVLSPQVPNGQPAQHNLCTRLTALGQLVVDDVPLGIHNGLVLGWIIKPAVEVSIKHTSGSAG